MDNSRDKNLPGGELSSPFRTIVGGRPPEPEQALRQASTGIQRLLLAASADEKVKKRFCRAPREAATDLGISLTETEKAILSTLPEERLKTMVELINRPNPSRRDFLKKTAASFGLAAATSSLFGLEGCIPQPLGGARPDMPDRPSPTPSSPGPSSTPEATPSPGTSPSQSPSLPQSPSPTRSPGEIKTRGISPDRP